MCPRNSTALGSLKKSILLQNYRIFWKIITKKLAMEIKFYQSRERFGVKPTYVNYSDIII